MAGRERQPPKARGERGLLEGYLPRETRRMTVENALAFLPEGTACAEMSEHPQFSQSRAQAECLSPERAAAEEL